MNELINAKAALSKTKPVKLLKTSESDDLKISLLTHTGLKKEKNACNRNNTDSSCESSVKLIPRDDGDCDIHFTCSCGEITVIRCHTLASEAQKSSSGSAAEKQSD
ncbi:MAG: hypothetical protein AAF984_10570 [Verrucomicrobiota bacterium]